MHNISVDKRRLLREKIINGAQEYNIHLVNKTFLTVCEDGYTDAVFVTTTSKIRPMFMRSM